MEKKAEESSEIKSRFLESCEENAPEYKIGPFLMVIFGGTGDLSQRKLLPALYHLYQDEKFKDGFKILSVGLSKLSDDAYRDFVESALKKFSPENFDEKNCSEFTSYLHHLSGSAVEDSTYQKFASIPREVDLIKQLQRVEPPVLSSGSASTFPSDRREAEKIRPVQGDSCK